MGISLHKLCSSLETAFLCALCSDSGDMKDYVLLQASKEAVLRQIGEAECVHLATHMSWKLSAIVLSPGGDMVDSQHPKRFFSSSAASASGGIAGQTASVTGQMPTASDQGDEEGSEVSSSSHGAAVCLLQPQLMQ